MDFISKVIEGGETFDSIKWQSDGKMQSQLIDSTLWME